MEIIKYETKLNAELFDVKLIKSMVKFRCTETY